MRTPPLRCIALFAASLLTILSTISLAQNGRGIIVGRVTDIAGAVLQGAEIRLAPQAATAVSNAVGEFTITNLSPGSYTVTVTYVGFSPFTAKVDVTAGQTARMLSLPVPASDPVAGPSGPLASLWRRA